MNTIFEIGGQDKQVHLVKVCAAGTGSFLKKQAEKLSIAIKDEFGDRALAAPDPVHMGEGCTLFMESGLVGHQAAGEQAEDGGQALLQHRAELSEQSGGGPVGRARGVAHLLPPTRAGRAVAGGIPRTMFFREWLPFFSVFCQRLSSTWGSAVPAPSA